MLAFGTAAHMEQNPQTMLNELQGKNTKRFPIEAATVWTYILEKPSVLRQALGGQCFGDVVEGEQRSVLLQAILALHWLQQNGNELWPLPGAIQASHLGDEHCNLGGYLL